MKKIIVFLILCNQAFTQQLSNSEREELSNILNSPKTTLRATKVFSSKIPSGLELNSIKKEFKYCRSIPSKFERQILTALSFYPELRNCSIEFVRQNIKTTMACRPTSSVITKRSNRDYIITIDTDDESKGIILDNVPYNAQVGVIGHELAHIVDYESKSSLSIVKLGIDYAQGNYPPDFEKSIDKLTIEKGLGWQLYDWSDFVLNKSDASKEYKTFKRNTYLTPSEIKSILKKDKNYEVGTTKGVLKNDFIIETYGVLIGVFVAVIFIPKFRNALTKRLKWNA
jgi:hypothetical protein